MTFQVPAHINNRFLNNSLRGLLGETERSRTIQFVDRSSLRIIVQGLRFRDGEESGGKEQVQRLLSMLAPSGIHHGVSLRSRFLLHLRLLRSSHPFTLWFVLS